ncbi:MAG: 2-amino-4-hydroxy-6-hydroxymethyldihydropteridine diphosphokinase [Flavobacteriales bacterium CG_4_9_14_3_um_filter_32_8]|nr:MAG: 2-amino-4-hydroxy-6-hydroxymethyldihydropteridine diphosphokinase [Flavobacteriales bacterium CG_4_9_14_3_um_filter_32_8]
MSKQVVFSLGGNVGNVSQTFLKAINSLEKKVGKLIKSSTIYTTKAWGIENQPDFINQIVIFKTQLLPHEVLIKCLQIEKELGRKRIDGEKWQQRVIDIDILFYESEIINFNNLIIPHPYLHQRNFVLFPLAELMPEFIHPLLRKTIAELKKGCQDNLKVIKLLA